MTTEVMLRKSVWKMHNVEYMPIIPALGRQRKKDKFEATLSYQDLVSKTKQNNIKNQYGREINITYFLYLIKDKEKQSDQGCLFLVIPKHKTKNHINVDKMILFQNRTQLENVKAFPTRT
jgi:hypothetical protein